MAKAKPAPASPVTPSPEPSDPFDLSKLRLSQDFASGLGVKKVITQIPVRKPDKQSFFRVHESPHYHFDTAILELKAEREAYLVAKPLWSVLANELIQVTLFTAITRQNVLFLWPIRLPDPDGRCNEWHRSARTAAEHAMKKWLRAPANMNLGGYEIMEATAPIPDPEWPDLKFQDIVRTAFKGRYIDNLDHPVIRSLRGEA